ncbi:DGQHR domain-containing protein [Lysinibacillus fusiformis]|uniref:DGQHR domain-containing protein n=1 Tax=Lysinibacillus fusiformis TaxID=28031 RepID=UPI00215B3AF6|nr:DGQHR domain-containing protein [Lysinibacillus fusiformis]MCR8855183.1 DGQHR domain-containing protein [Lysinibacillus fusiformis]
MKTPYIRVLQKGEVFFLTKFKARELKNLVHFHVRDPYKNTNADNKYDKFIEKLKDKNIKFKESDKEVQRRLTLNRVSEIRKFIESDQNFLPNTVILSIDITSEEEFQNKYLEYENTEIGYFEFDDNAEFMIVDGQHRLAGIFSINDSMLDEIEVPAVVLFNITVSTAAKLFADINGKVKPVNRSLIYDLYEEIDDKEYSVIKKIHAICKAFYENENSPLYRQIKMLGIGNGAISQAFFIDYVKVAIKQAGIEDHDLQYIFNHLFYYFTAFQDTFPEDWPVKRLKDQKYNDEYSKYVLKVRKSQLVKTNGFGAIMKLFPLVYNEVKDEQDFYNGYHSIIRKLSGKVEWNSDNYQGTGKKFQNIIFDRLKEILF